MFRREAIRRELMANGMGMVLGEKTLIMGILNVTPDSFSDGGLHLDLDTALAHAEAMIREGADILDVGGESTRPGSTVVSAEEEAARIMPVIRALKVQTNHLISVDTYKAVIADEALAAGAHLINDVWGFQKDPDMAAVAASHQVPSILMHNQVGTAYDEDLIAAMRRFFDQSIERALKAGLKEKYIILDPGIGFGKTPIQNVEVMRRLDEIKAWGFPVLLGASRKSMIGRILDLPVDERLEGTLATHVVGVMAGCEMVRVHDVRAHVRAMKVVDSLLKGTLDG